MVEPGQTWRHKPSGDVRVVFDVVTWEQAAGEATLPDFQRTFGITHVARMIHPDPDGAGEIVRDRRDSSDMELVVRVQAGGRTYHPAHRSSWELVT